MIFITNNQATKVLKPSKKAFNPPSSLMPPQRATILSRALYAINLMRGDHLNATFLPQSLIKFVAVICSVTDQIFRHFFQKTGIQGRIYQSDFMGISTGCVNGDRKTASVCKAHNFGSFAPFGVAHTIAPFFAGAKLPSIKPSLKSIPPRSLRSLAKAVRILAKTPDSVHRWKCRWQVLLGGYRSGKSAQGAPVRRIQRIPFTIARESLGGRPDFPGSALGFGMYSAIRCHCSFVRSIYHISALNYLKIEVLG